METVKTEKKRVLVVDDDEIQLLIVTAMLQDEYETINAKSGQEALNYFIQGLIPHIILLDVVMPNMDGWEIFHIIHGITLLQNIPIVFITSLEDEEEKARRIGAAGYIKKPYEQADLLNRIKNVIKS